jgi:large subunit ribosomal protein L18
MKNKELNQQRIRKAKRTRAKIGKGTKERPRLSVFRSNNHIYAQIINDTKGETLVSSSSYDIKDSSKGKKKTEIAEKVGELIAEKAKKANIKKVVFDKGRYNYHGRVKILAEAARKGGLKF